MARRERRVARSVFRQHSTQGVYIDRDGEETPVRITTQVSITLDGEYQEMIYQSDMVQVLTEELPQHDTSRSRITCLETGKDYTLGREVMDDGYIRTIEVEPT